MKENIKVGIIQMDIKSNIFDDDVRKENIEKAISGIEKVASAKDVDLIVLPEEFYAASGYGALSMWDNINKISDGVLKELGEIARKYNVNIVGGLATKFKDSGSKGSNIGFVIDRKGDLIGYQERLHLSTREEKFYLVGNRIETFNLDIGRIGIAMGLDILYPEVARKLVALGCEIIISPVIFAERTNESSYPSDFYCESCDIRAMENQVYSIMVNGVGDYPYNDLYISGLSTVSGPCGRIMQLGKNESFEMVEINKKEKDMAEEILPVLKIKNDEILND